MLSVGCGGPAEERPLYGVWVIESADSLARRIGAAGRTDDRQRQLPSAPSTASDSGQAADIDADLANRESPLIDDSDASDPLPPRMELWFRPGGVLKTFTRMGRINPEPKTGRWKLISHQEQPQLMVIECELLGQMTEHEIDFIDADTIELIPPNMAGTTRKIRFQRQSQLLHEKKKE